MKVGHALITVMYLLKYVPKEEIELIYNLSDVPHEVYDMVKDYKLEFFDKYNPLYLDDVTERYFTSALERHGISCYD